MSPQCNDMKSYPCLNLLKPWWSCQNDSVSDKLTSHVCCENKLKEERSTYLHSGRRVRWKFEFLFHWKCRFLFSNGLPFQQKKNWRKDCSSLKGLSHVYFIVHGQKISVWTFTRCSVFGNGQGREQEWLSQGFSLHVWPSYMFWKKTRFLKTSYIMPCWALFPHQHHPPQIPSPKQPRISLSPHNYEDTYRCDHKKVQEATYIVDPRSNPLTWRRVL